MEKRRKIITGLAIGTAILAMSQCGYYIIKNCEYVKEQKEVVKPVPTPFVDDVIYHLNGKSDFKVSFPDEVQKVYSKAKSI